MHMRSIFDSPSNSVEICYLVKNTETNNPIKEATIRLVRYNYPECMTCPTDLDGTTDVTGKACISVTSGWSCDYTEVTATGYQPKSFDGKPPLKIYLSPIPDQE